MTYRILACLGTTLALALPGAHAQTTSPHGTVRIIVRDATGAVLAGASATLVGPGQGRSTRTGTNGVTQISGLSFGRYMLVVTAPGFATRRMSLTISSDLEVVQSVVLTPGSVNTSIDVIAASPIGSLDVPLSDVPLPVQTLTAQTLEDTNAIDLTDTLKRRLNGVYVNENQNNPFQPDVNYRGYTASPLVGTPAGLSVYLDGVRQNQPFGDVVQWDFIPKIAITTTELIPGSDPVYGLNTLGGAIAIQTKDGLANGGTSGSGYGGSFGRRAVDMESGGSKGPWNWFAGGTLFHEDGWRVRSPSSVRQSFAKLGYNAGNTAVSLSGGYSINTLVGNGTQDVRALNRTTGLNHGYNSVYTIPDSTYQHAPFLTLNVTQALNTALTFNLNAFVGYARQNSSNGDANDDSFDQSLYALSTADKAALTKAGIPYPTTASTAANTPFPYLRCVAGSLELNAGGSGEPAEKCTGVDTDGVTRQHHDGVTAALTWTMTHNRLSVGAGFDRGGITFVQNSQWGYINPDGITITRVPSFDNGTEVNDDGYLDDARVNLHGVTTTPSFYITDTLSLGKWVLNAGGRYNHTDVNNTDRLPASTSGRAGLTADNQFARFNPTAGIVYKAHQRLNGYFDYGESSRAPTTTELGCADPTYPCALPNALVSDPPLQQVVARTFEFGVRGNPGGRYRWNAGYFHTENYNDLLFIASPQTGFGYFTNFSKTRRQGVEASVTANVRTLSAGAEYTFLQATYQSTEVIESGSNSSNSNALSGEPGVTDGGLITITPGNTIPQHPRHLLKLYTDYHPLRKLSINADLELISSSYVRGNDNNLHRPDGVYYLGSGTTPGYGVVNLGSRYTFNAHYQLFAEVNNALNRHYYTTGQLSDSPYDNNGNFIGRPFVAYASGDSPLRNTTYDSPGAPITIFGGLRVSFGKAR